MRYQDGFDEGPPDPRRYDTAGYNSAPYGDAGGQQPPWEPDQGEFQPGTFPARHDEAPADEFRPADLQAGRYRTGGFPASGYQAGQDQAGPYRTGGFPASQPQASEPQAGRYRTGGFPASQPQASQPQASRYQADEFTTADGRRYGAASPAAALAADGLGEPARSRPSRGLLAGGRHRVPGRGG